MLSSSASAKTVLCSKNGKTASRDLGRVGLVLLQQLENAARGGVLQWIYRCCPCWKLYLLVLLASNVSLPCD